MVRSHITELSAATPPSLCCQEYQAKGTSAKHLIVPHKMDETQRQAAKDLLDLAGKMAKF